MQVAVHLKDLTKKSPNLKQFCCLKSRNTTNEGKLRFHTCVQLEHKFSGNWK